MTITADTLPNLPGAACRATPDPEVFFPATSGGRPSKWEQLLWDEAAEMCSHCPVRVQCLEWAIEHHEVGIWGGTTDEERRRLTVGVRRMAMPKGHRRRVVSELHEAGLPDGDIARQLGVSRSVIFNDRQAMNLPANVPQFAERRARVAELHAKGLNDREVGDVLGVSRDIARHDREIQGLEQNYSKGGPAA